MDRFSGLPDDIIRLILKYLPANKAAFLLILSGRFRNLYTTIGDLEFDDRADQFQETFTDFVNANMNSLDTTSCISRFSLRSQVDLDSNRINEWLSNVLKRSLMYLELSIFGGNGYSLPSEIFSCRTIVKLQLGRNIVIRDVPRNAFLRAVKILILESVRFVSVDECAFGTLLLACPVLLELNIDGFYWETWKWLGRLSNPSLQKLIIARDLSENFDGPEYQSISFDTPSLTYLDYTDIVPDAYPNVNIESLVEAKLDLQVVANHQWDGEAYPGDDDILSSNPTNLITGIKSVQILELSSFLTFQMLNIFRQCIPMFENLHHLTMFHEDAGVCWRFLPILLRRSPNLKTLVIEGGLHYDEYAPAYVCGCLSGYTFLSSSRLEVLEITLHEGGRNCELAQVECFLGKLKHLKLLIVKAWGLESFLLKITEKMLRFRRASAECRVEMKFQRSIW